MSTRIPLPGNMIDSLLSGMRTGSAMYTGIMNPILNRENQQVNRDIHKEQNDITKARNAQLAEQFAQEMALRKQAESRMGANTGLNRQLLQQQIENWQHKNDPMYAVNQYKALENFIKGKQSGAHIPVPIQESGQGMGLYTPEGLKNAQSNPQNNSRNGGIDMELMREHPELRGFAKQYLKFDPLAAPPQTPEEKEASALNLYTKKEAIKNANKGGDIATNKVLTQNQQSLQAIDTVLPMVDNFINNPDSVYGPGDFNPSKKAAYEAKTGGMIDLLVAAQSLPQVKESVNLVADQVRRRTNESRDAYVDRLKDFKKDLMNRRGKAIKVVTSKKVDTSPSEDFTSMSDDDLRRIAGGG